MNNRMEKGKDIGADTGKSHESPESRASRLACELRRVDEAIDMLGRELAAAVTQREAETPHRRVLLNHLALTAVLSDDLCCLRHVVYVVWRSNCVPAVTTEQNAQIKQHSVDVGRYRRLISIRYAMQIIGKALIQIGRAQIPGDGLDAADNVSKLDWPRLYTEMQRISDRHVFGVIFDMIVVGVGAKLEAKLLAD